MIPLHDENPTYRRAWVTIVLVVVNVAVYFLVQPGAAEVDATARFSYRHAAIPCEVTTFEPLSVDELRFRSCDRDGAATQVFPDKRVLLAVVASMFFHGSLLHLGGNMLFLWIFGNNAEDRLGPARYLLFYLIAGVVATATHVAIQPDSTIPVIGASGAVAGVMGAYLVWFPSAPIRTLVFVGFFAFFTRIAAKWLLGFWFVSQFFINPNAGVAWGAHVGGFVFGVVIALLLRPQRRGPVLGHPDWVPPAGPRGW